MSITKMRELTKAQSTDNLLLAYNELDTTTTRETRTEAEKLTISVIGGELSSRARKNAKTASVESLLEAFSKNAALNYAKMSGVQQMDYWAVSDELEARYPEAARITNEWLDNLTPADKESAQADAWEKKFLSCL